MTAAATTKKKKRRIARASARLASGFAWLGSAFASVWGRLELDLSDFLAVGGILAAAYGAHMIYPPAGFIVGGLLCAAFGLLSILIQARGPRGGGGG